MTLLINLIGPNGIYQSSDYRLTDRSTGKTVDDEFGSKQVHFLAKTWSAQVSFTGFAKIGSRKTRDWILDTFQGSVESAAHAAMAKLAERATAELCGIPHKDWSLTIVATVVEKDHEPRLFVVSCNDRPGKPPLEQPLDHFEVTEVLADCPRELFFGYTRAVSGADRRFVKSLNKRRTDEAGIRRALARINARSAKRSNEMISAGCLVSSTMMEGFGAWENVGPAPGLPADIAGSEQMAELIRKAHDNRPVLRGGQFRQYKNVSQAALQIPDGPAGRYLMAKVAADLPALCMTDDAGGTYKRTPKQPGASNMDLDAEWARLEDGKTAGPTHRIVFSSTPGSYTFKGPDRSDYGSMEFVAATGEVIVAKNRVSKITLGNLVVRALPAFQHQPQAMETHWFLQSQLTINGSKPKGWDYTVEMVLRASGALIRLHQNSVALRSLSSVRETEELVVASSTNPQEIEISKDDPSASAVIEARLFLRDISETRRETSLRAGSSDG